MPLLYDMVTPGPVVAKAMVNQLLRDKFVVIKGAADPPAGMSGSVSLSESLDGSSSVRTGGKGWEGWVEWRSSESWGNGGAPH